MISERLRALIERVACLGEEHRAAVIAGLHPPERRALFHLWRLWAHDGQAAPDSDWRVWLIRAGRGFGKTRAGAEWVSEIARADPAARIALLGATAEDVTRVMIEGESGVIAVARMDEGVAWKRDAGEVIFPSGARAFVYSAEAPEKLRGPEHHAAWCDELAKWRYGDVAWDNLMLGLRLGEHPRALVTTTPRPVPLMRRVMAMPGLVTTRGTTFDNPHLPQVFVEAVTGMYGGTRLGRQELDGELIEEVAGALWPRDLIEACRVPPGTGAAPAFERVVVGVDPPAGVDGDACGIVAVGLANRIGYVIEDASVAGRSPEGWARAVADCAARVGADRVIAEINQGGAMVKSVLHAADAGLPVTTVHASKGKIVRAEPVAALYEAGRARHLGVFRELEDELCGLVVGGAYEGPGRSPDRADALVWAMTELMLGKRGMAAVRGL